MSRLLDQLSEFSTASAEEIEKKQRSHLDASTRVPVLVFFSCAVFWLLFGTILALISSIKMHHPEFLGDISWLTFGRVRPAHLNTVIYGWATAAGMGTAIWLVARLCRTPLRGRPLLLVAAFFWNLGVLIGTLGILGGNSTAIKWLEFPGYATPLLFISYTLIAIWALLMFASRKPGHIYISLWYLLAALFWFPWVYGTAQILLIAEPVQGSVQGIIHWWFVHNVLSLWFTPIGLAAAYYFIPKVLGKPIYNYYLAGLGFWSLALFYSWNAGHHLIGGPLPVWIVTVGIASSLMMVVPVVVVGLNHLMTMKGQWHRLHSSPTLRFIVFGSVMYLLVSLQGISMSFRSWNEITHFTHYTVGHAHMGMYGFFTMIMFGSMYYIVPRVVQCEWRSPWLIQIHFWASFYGILLMLLVLLVGGFWQGLSLNNPTTLFEQIIDGTIPFLIGRSLSGVLLLIAHVVFGYHFFLMIMRMGQPVDKAQGRASSITEKSTTTARELLSS